MDWRNPEYASNIRRDWCKAQGVTHVSDSHVRIPRDINIRHISIENSSVRPMGVAITTFYLAKNTPKLQIILAPGEIKDIGVNPYGSPMQFIHPLDPNTGEEIGDPCPIHNNGQSFVLRDGLQGIYVQIFKTAGYHSR